MSGSRDLYRGAAPFAVRMDRLSRPGAPASEGEFERVLVEHPGAVVVLAADDDERVCCLRQYRHPVQRILVELPAGLCDAPGEDPVEAGRRELREEVALAAREWTPLLSAYSSPGVSAEIIHYFLARGLESADRGDFAMRHEEAEIEPFWVPFEDLRAAVLDGRISDGPVALAVLAAAARGLLGSRPAGE